MTEELKKIKAIDEKLEQTIDDIRSYFRFYNDKMMEVCHVVNKLHSDLGKEEPFLFEGQKKEKSRIIVN